jgi:hypothetical protein
MGGRRWIGIVAAMLLVAACGGDDGANTFVIENTVDFGGNGTFVVTEGATDFGCESGTVAVFVEHGDDMLPVSAEETYRCENGDREGSFTVLHAIDEADEDGSTGTWRLTRPSADYSGLEASGTFTVEVASDHTNATVTGEFNFSE